MTGDEQRGPGDEQRGPGDEGRAPGDRQGAPGDAQRAPGDRERAPGGYLDMPLREFLAELSAAQPAPSGGGAAALSVALGASLCAMAAGLSARALGAQADQLRTEAQRLCDRAAALIQADADAYRGVLDARRRAAGRAAASGSTRPPGRPFADPAAEVTAALAAAATVPMEIVELGAAAAGIAATLATRGNPNLRGDAITGALLAEAGARAAAELVRINLAGAPSDDRPARAYRLLLAAERAVADAAVAGSPTPPPRSQGRQ